MFMQMRKAGLIVGVICLMGLSGVANTALAQGSQTFNNPKYKNYRLDWCLHWGAQCGQPAADAWCAKKYGKADGHAKKWGQAADIGASSPTYVIGDGKVCNQAGCDGFKSITCVYSLD